MCCFAQPVLSVSDTHLFARLLENGKQVLAYQMKYRSERPNAMILPLPVATPAGEDAVRFKSLKDYDRFFTDLNRAFPSPPQFASGRVNSRALPTGKAPLEVHEVGDFIASFVPTMNDFSRLDPQFVIPRESWEKIPGYSDYGFAVFQLKSLAGKPHPIAFEFATRWTDRIFFPTVHIHDGEVHEREDFDHMLYVQHAEWDRLVGAYRGPRSPDPATGYVRSKKKAKDVCNIAASQGLLAPELLLHRWEIRGNFLNRDYLTNVAEPTVRAAGKGRSNQGAEWLLKLAPWTIGLGGLAWFIGRRAAVARDQLRAETTPESPSHQG